MKKIIALILILALVVFAVYIFRPGEVDLFPGIERPVATIDVQDYGTMKFKLDPSAAPQTVANFISLANSGFYDGQKIFRVINGGIIQSGDPSGDGTGNAGYSIYGEFSDNGWDQNGISHKRGVISMARTSTHDSGSSQFFILIADHSIEYDGRYAAFGTMEGEESFQTLDMIATCLVDVEHVPVKDIIIDSIRVETFGFEYQFDKIEEED